VLLSLSSFIYLMTVNDNENRLAEVFATIIGTIVKYTEYMRPSELANILRIRKE